ncbi:syntaxin-52-like [Zingiber officinale]|uniref:syntaxin-52-like n=1 Tax=Zingiber officinale TaxID=94328 RepID=UPI001C4B5416|nr:syntaxin-52-like [Zingiber officinale]
MSVKQGLSVAMTTSFDPWTRDFNEASKLFDDIAEMVSEMGSLPPSGPDTQCHLSTIRRKRTILKNRLESLESLLPKYLSDQSIKDFEINKHHDLLSNLKSKANQMSSTIDMPNFANREELLGHNKRSVEIISITPALDNQGIVSLQRQTMKEQDEGLEKLGETLLNTKHIALSINEELDLHTRLIDDLDDHVEITDSTLQRVQKTLSILNKRTKGSCSCRWFLLSVVTIVILIVLVYTLIKFL